MLVSRVPRLAHGLAMGRGVSRGMCDHARVRNVGIIAHIDAGKTTTTERMLLLSGVTRSAGRVDSGDTVMDFMEQERERGITIQAAATSFHWGDHTFNLIDTPGHVDFTIEVERSTRVLDGAVLIVDAVAGSQAQTETVWRQARAHSLPAVAFINKMDREGADFPAAVASLEERLAQLMALPIQMPVRDAAGAFVGAVDLCELELLRYERADPSHGTRADGDVLVRARLLEGGSGWEGAEAGLEEEAIAARAALVERVADLEDDGEVAELFLEDQPVPAQTLRAALRRLTLSGDGVPVLCGASLHGNGVEALLDAVGNYLPAPSERPRPVLLPPSGEGEGVACEKAARGVALAFKVGPSTTLPSTTLPSTTLPSTTSPLHFNPPCPIHFNPPCPTPRCSMSPSPRNLSSG